MIFDIITIFPNIFDSYFKESFLFKAKEKGVIEINIHNLRDWTDDEHKTVDDRPYGGGLGMVMKLEPIYKAVSDLKNKNSKVIVFSPRGERFTQKKASEFSKCDQIIMICGRYEGIDERVLDNIADEKISIGEFDLMGGELPAMIVTETVSRLIPNVLGKPEFLKERKSKKSFIEYPQYTRPEIFKTEEGKEWKVPEVLVSGNHKEIDKWREEHKKIIEK